MKKDKEILNAYKTAGARIETKARVKLKTKEDFATYYTPGVGVASRHLALHPQDARAISVKKNSVAVISDGSAVLGLGNIGPYGALPVMEGKALIFKEMAGIDAWPLVLDTQDPDEIVRIVQAIAPNFGGINLEDIKAPECFEIERRLTQVLDIPVMHDDQHGTAIVVLAGLINAAQVVGKNIKKLKVVVLGAGAAGVAIAKLLTTYGVADVVVIDRKGVVHSGRSDLNASKRELAGLTNPRALAGSLSDALLGADAFVGVSGPNLVSASDIERMAEKAIVFALSNPTPEIMPEEARKGGAVVIATGRSDFPNQINNALVFPGVFRGALDKKVSAITEASKVRAAKALAALVARPGKEKIIPDVLDKRVVPAIAQAIRK